jgi:oleate hydratase
LTQALDRKAYIVGAGVAGLAAAVYLIREGGVRGADITILTRDPVTGGALDGSGSAEEGYLIRGGRMFEAHFVCTWDLLSQVPSLREPGKSVTEEVFDFNRGVVTGSNARLLQAGKKLDASSYGLAPHDLVALLKLNFSREESLSGRRIDEWFAPNFFDTVFWHLWRSTFAFQSWSSVAEMRRYAVRFMHLLPGFHRLEGILRTYYSQYDSVVRPLETWLRGQGVRFLTEALVTDVDFDLGEGRKTATAIHYQTRGEPRTTPLAPGDRLFVTLGSMVEGSTTGAMDRAAPTPETAEGVWNLWEKLAAKDPDFGRPGVFSGRVDQSKWMSFTVTLKTPAFFEYMEHFTGNTAGTGGLVTLIDSNWFMSVVLAHQPHFANQPDGVFVFWGDGLSPDAEGNYVNKRMSDCTGEEILTELFAHLGILDRMSPLMGRMGCVPCMMPYIDSQFMPRAPGDRPSVVPPGATNFAFLGQFVELPDDCVFTVEYSVRTAQTAVFSLLGLEREVPPIYRGAHDIHVLLGALSALKR